MRAIVALMQPHTFISSPEAARILGKSTRTIHRLVAAGVLTPALTAPGGPNGAYLFERSEVERLAEEMAA